MKMNNLLAYRKTLLQPHARGTMGYDADGEFLPHEQC